MRKKRPNIVIEDFSSISAIRDRAFDNGSDELFGLAESLRYLLANGSVDFPMEAAFPDPPDILLTMAGKRLAIEVRRVTRQRLSEVSASLSQTEILELNRDLFVDKRARRDKRASSGTRSGDFRAIKKKGEPLNGRGWVGNEWRDEVVLMLGDAIHQKQQHLDIYRASSAQVWLTLIDCVGMPRLMNDVTHAYTAAKVGDLARQSQFQKVLLIDFSGGILDLNSLDR